MVHLNTSSHVNAQPSITGLGSLREAPSGARTLCFGRLRREDYLGDLIATDPWLEDTLAPLVARFAALVFTEQSSQIESFVQQLRWVSLEFGIDHVVLPLWPESKLAQEVQMVAIAMGLPADFILSQDEDDWPHQSVTYQQSQRSA